MLHVLTASQDLPLGAVPPHKPHPGKPGKTSAKTDAFIKCSNPFITSTEIREMYPELLKDIAARTIHEWLLFPLLKTRTSQPLVFTSILHHWLL